MEDHDDAYKANLRVLIAESDLSDDQFGAIAGVSRTTVSEWLKPGGTRAPRVKELARIARHFDVTTDWIIGLSEARNGLPHSFYMVDLDYVDAVKRGEATDPYDAPGAPVPPRAKLMSSQDYERLKRRLKEWEKKPKRKERGK